MLYDNPVRLQSFAFRKGGTHAQDRLWPGLSPAGRALTGVTAVDDLDKAIAASIE
jgi:hypothetical protein